jgi:hypothetical protein
LFTPKLESEYKQLAEWGRGFGDAIKTFRLDVVETKGKNYLERIKINSVVQRVVRYEVFNNHLLHTKNGKKIELEINKIDLDENITKKSISLFNENYWGADYNTLLTPTNEPYNLQVFYNG